MTELEVNKIICGDTLEQLKKLPDESINCVMTSPPYWALRDYKIKCQLGLEPDFNNYVNKLCNIFDEIKRVLKDEGTCWVNLGDTYNAHSMGNCSDEDMELQKGLGDNWKKQRNCKPNLPDKSLCNIPARFSIEMQNRGWILRNVIIWHKPNCMPCSVKDRFTVDFEYLFFFVKNKKYWFETQYENLVDTSYKDKRIDKGLVKHKKGKEFLKQDLTGNPTYTGFNERYKKSQYAINGTCINSFGRNKRCVWTITTQPFKEAHFATYPEELCYTPIKAGCPEKGIVLDPFFGSGTTGLVALKLNRNFIGIELNPNYIEIAKNRLKPYLEQEKLI